jgi:transcription elongation factor Elf1
VQAESALRKLILKVLLGSLALAAVAGVLAVLFANDVVLRVMATGFLTAGAALVMLPLSRWVDRKEKRPAGLFGLVAVVIEFILVLMLIWEMYSVLPGQRDWEQLWMTVGAVAAASVGGMLFLVAAQRPDARVAGVTGLGVTLAFFVAAVVGSWGPRQLVLELWSTAWTIAVFGALLAAALVGAGTGDKRHWRWFGVAASAVAAYLLIVETWTRTGDWETFSLFAAASLYVAYANLIMRVPLKPRQRWLLVASLVAGAATAVLSELIVFGLDDDIVTRSTAAVAILASCGTMAMGVLARLNRRVDYEPLSREMLHITLVCPNCRKKQSVELGGAACKSCGLRIEVRIEEPRCTECDYLLYMLTSDQCPECGAPIRSQPASTE